MNDRFILNTSSYQKKKSCFQRYCKTPCCSNLTKGYSLYFSFMMTVLSTYLISTSLQLSPLISKDSHYGVTIFSYTYNLLYSMLITYFLFNYGRVVQKNNEDSLLYWTSCHLGAIGFALLGEIPVLKDFAVVPGFWKHLKPEAWIILLFFGSIISYFAVKEAKQSCRDKKCSLNLLKILGLGFGYGLLYALLIINNAKTIHLHVHHAICAGILSLWFTDWKYCMAEIMHGILIGVVVEGISFYGIGELSLFLVSNSDKVNLSSSLIPCFLVLLVSLVFYFVN